MISRFIKVLCLFALGALGWSVAAQEPAAPGILVVDAGHGGYDPGVLSADGLREKDITLALARLIYIKAAGEPDLRVHLTRSEDRALSIAERVGLGQEADVYLALHTGYALDPAAQGPAFLIPDGACPDCLRLAAILEHEFRGTLSSHFRGVRRAPLFLSRVRAAALLIEIGLLSHPEEAWQLGRLTYQDAVADAILAGVRAFLRQRPGA